MDLVKNIKYFFKAKASQEKTGSAPEGICPNCWGEQEWEGQYYEMMRAKNITPETDTYNSFIKEIVTTHIDGIAIKHDTLSCTTCNRNYKS